MVESSSGPWINTGEKDRLGGLIIRQEGMYPHNQIVAYAADFNSFKRDAEVAANADLIAASPQLLNAARKALPLIIDEWTGTSEDSNGNIVIRLLEAAIAKAEGRKP